jgi:hypothetical protein
MVIMKTDSLLNRMNKHQLRTIIQQYENLTDNLRHQVLLLKCQILLETPNLQFRVPVEVVEEDDPDEIPDIPNFDPNLPIKKRKDVMYQ